MESVIKLQVRVPADLHAWLMSQSKNCDRSLNGQILHFLKKEMQVQSQQKQNPAP